MSAVSAGKAARMWAVALLLAVVCTAGGPAPAAALLLGAACFAAGCLTSLCRAGRLVYRRSGRQFFDDHHAAVCPAGRGLSMVGSFGQVNNADADAGTSRSIAGDPQIDQQLEEFLDCAMREFVMDAWYSCISDCATVPAQLRCLVRSVLTRACDRASRADWTGWLTRRAPNLFAGHVRLYRRSLQRRQGDPVAGFFRLERETDGRSRAALCQRRHRLGEFLARLAESLAGRLLLAAPGPGGHACHRRLLAELVASAALRGIDWLASPDSVNQLIVRLSGQCDVDSLLQALATSSEPAEVAALESFAAGEVVRLRARDCGGSDDDEVRAGMASLDFLRRRCHERAAQLRRRRLPFDAVMSSPAGLAAFHAHLDSVGCGRYLGFYLNIEGWRGGGSSSEAAVCILSDHLEGPAAQELRQLNSSIVRRAQQQLQAASSAASPAASRSASTGLAAVLEDLRSDLLRLLAQNQFYGQFTTSEEYTQLMDSLDEDQPAAGTGPADDSAEVLAGPETGVGVLSGEASDARGDSELLASVVRHETTKTGSETYTSYAIRVTRPPAAPGQPTIQWELLRRYSEFSDLQSGLAARYSRLGRLSFPAKTSMRGRLNPSLVEQRRRQLDVFLRAVIDACAGAGADAPQAESALKLLRQFLRQPEEELQQQQQTSSGNALDSLIDGVRRSFMKRPRSTPTFGLLLDSAASANSAAAANAIGTPTTSGSDSDVDDESSDDGGGSVGNRSSNLPLRLLLLLLDEVFDLRDRSRVLRKAVVSTLSRLLRALLGDRVNRRIIDWARLLTGPQSVADGLRQLREALFDQPVPPPERQPADAMRARLLCRAVLLASVPGELRQLLSNEAVRQGVDRLFRMLQCEELNRRLLLVLLESALAVAFPECRLEPLLARLAARAEAEEAVAAAAAAGGAS